MDHQADEWSREQFMAFILVFAAHSDLHIDQEEVDLIASKYGQERVDIAMKTRADLNDAQQLSLIEGFRASYYSSKDEEDAILEEIKAIYMADEKYDVMERSAMMMLKKIIHS